MRKNAQKIPEDWVKCPVCGLPYGFVRCRYTTRGKNGIRNLCLSCIVKEKKLLQSKNGGILDVP